MEEIKAEIKELKGDLKEIKHTMLQNTVALAEYNKELGIHISASKDLNTRMIPLEDHVKFVRGLLWLGMKILGAGASIAAIIHYWPHL